MNENELVLDESGGEATIIAFTENEDFYIYEVDFVDTDKVQGWAIFNLLARYYEFLLLVL